MTFQLAAERQIPFQHLNSIYKSAVHSEPDKAVFKTEAGQQQFEKLLGKFIKKYTFSLTAEDKFAQCRPVTYQDAGN